MTDYYATLGIDKTATAADIKKAYRALVKTAHPDKNPDDPTAATKMAAINDAYDTLGDPEKRAEYDRGGARDPNDYYGRDPFARSSFTDPFESYFGHRNTGPVDMHQDIAIPIPILSAGGAVMFQVGSAMNPFSQPTSVRVVLKPNTLDGTVITMKPDEHRVPGVGNLVITIRAASDREGNYEVRFGNILMPLQLDVFMALCGGSVIVDIPTGESVSVKIPRGTQAGRVMRIRGQGLERANGTRGDVMLHLSVVIPVLSDDMVDKIKAITSEADDIA